MNAAPWLGILLAATMLVVTACLGGSSATPSPSPTLSASPIPTPVYHAPSPTTAAPTFSPTPVPTPDPSVLAIRPCTADDLVVRFESGGAATGHLIESFGVANVSDTACRVRSAPGVDILDASGRVIGSGAACRSFATAYDTCLITITVLGSGPVPQPSVGPYAASFTLEWGNPANRGESCPETAPLAIELPDGGGRIDLGDVGMPNCAHPGSSELRPTDTPTPTPDPTVGYR